MNRVPGDGGHRPSVVQVDTGAIERNVAALVVANAPAAVCAVVKADGYGHGAVRSAFAAVRGGATLVAVATVEEAEQLRGGGIDVQILLLSEPFGDAVERCIALDLDCTVYTDVTIDRLAAAAERAGGSPARVHLKVDTGMSRVGCSIEDALRLAQHIQTASSLELSGVCSHLATSEERDQSFARAQLARFLEADASLRAAGIVGYRRHLANSGGALWLGDARFDIVRCGIACYGVSPDGADIATVGNTAVLEPALRLVSVAGFVKRVAADTPVSYGRHYVTDRPTNLVTVPIGYADGIDRRWGLVGGEVLIGGHRHRIAGAVTMDQITVDVGDAQVAVGDEVVLIGRQGDEEITPNEIARRIGTIGYEVVTRLGARLPRVELPGDDLE